MKTYQRILPGFWILLFGCSQQAETDDIANSIDIDDVEPLYEITLTRDLSIDANGPTFTIDDRLWTRNSSCVRRVLPEKRCNG